MTKSALVNAFFKDVIRQNADAIRSYFQKDALIKWHCSNECFNVDEYIVANCEYPGEWEGELKRVEIIDDLVISVATVYLQDRSVSFHVTSFIQFRNDKIIELNEYWGDDGIAPQWRIDKKIGKTIA